MTGPVTPQIAVLRCVARRADGTRCPSDATPGSRRCRRHSTAAPERMRCHHLFDDGVRCELWIHHLGRDKQDYCQAHYRPCPGVGGDGPCARHITTVAANLCRWCTARERAQLRRCGFETDEAEFCDTKAAGVAQHCGQHRRPLPSDEYRCTKTYTSGRRCHRRRQKHGDACVVHGAPCETCGKPTRFLAPARCRTHQPSCAEDGCDLAARRGALHCHRHDGKAACSEWSPAKDRRCSRPAKGNGRCGWHATLPADEQRCVVVYPDGKRCIAERLEGNIDGACRYHQHRPAMLARAPRPNQVQAQPAAQGRVNENPCRGCKKPTMAVTGWCLDCSQQQGRRCLGVNLTTGTRCRLLPTVGPLCHSHDRAQLPQGADRCVAMVDDEQGGELRCTVAPVEGADRCKAHGGIRPKRRCPFPTTRQPDGAQGVCRGAPMGNGVCPRHQTVLTLSDADRCVHTWDDGTRCALSAVHRFVDGSRQRVCPFHRVLCEEDGCSAKTADLERRRCPDHRVRCDQFVGAGSRCTRPAAIGHTSCERHLREVPEEERCRYVYVNGQQCHASRLEGRAQRSQVKVWRDLCLQHARPCVVEGCPSGTRFLDGRCVRHRPRCRSVVKSGVRCAWGALSPDGLCPRHHAVEHDRTCALRDVFGEPCRTPAHTEHGTDGRICERHLNQLVRIGEDRRCRHVYDTGERCAAERERRVRADGRQVLRDGCRKHLRRHLLCAVVTVTGEACGSPAVEEADGADLRCVAHPDLPDDERCVAEVRPGVRCPLGRTARHAACASHLAVLPRCGARIRSTGEVCDLAVYDGQEGCGRHLPPENDDDRCTITDEDDQRCRWRKQPHNRVCPDHRHLQPRCIAEPRGFRCRWFALEPHQTCDRHHGWEPGQLDHNQEALMRFFLTPRADTLMRLQEARTRLLLAELSTGLPDAVPNMWHTGYVGTEHSTYVSEGTVARTDDQLEGLPDEIKEIAKNDPHDLTGARRRYRRMLQDGYEPEEAALAVKLVSNGRATSTLRSYTSKLKPWFTWCEEHLVSPCPADPNDVLLFLGWLAERGRSYDGKPLQASTFTSFQTALSRLHKAMKHPNPFEVDGDLRMALHGYARTYGRVQRQAHAIRAPELVRLVTAAQGLKTVTDQQLRDEAILAIVTDPEVGLTQREAAALTWQDVVKWPSEGSDDPVVLVAGRGKKTEREVEVPNRSTGINPADLAGNEVPLVARLCGVAALRSLHARKVSSGKQAVGPVFPKPNGDAMGNTGIKKVLTTLCAEAGITYAPTLTFDDRSAALLALDEPDFIGLRDAAILCVSWWASLRRSEVAELTLGSIGADSRGRGLVVLVDRSKTDQEGQGRFVAVPHARIDGKTLPIDLQTNLHRYLAAYARRLGRPLNDDDPLFINAHHKTAKLDALKPDTIGEVVARYAEQAGIQAEIGEYLTHHGLRAGYATEALAGGMPAEAVARRQGRASTESLAGYFRLADPFEDSLAFLIDVDAFADTGAGFANVEDLLMQTDLDDGV